MGALGRFGGFVWGTNDFLMALAKDTNQPNIMTTANNGWAARFKARSTRDIKSVYVNFQAVSSPGTMELRIETIDATTGEPTGTLYDSNATKTFTPVANWQNVAFTTLPTTGLTVGNEYAIVLLKADAGTTCTLNSHVARSKETAHPAAVLTGADVSTRSNFAEVLNSTPILTVVFEDDVEESLSFCPFAQTTDRGVYSTRAVGSKLITVGQLVVSGIWFGYVVRSGTPENMRGKILNSSDGVVSGTTVTIDKDSLTLVSGNRVHALFDSPVTLSPGTYRVIMDQTDHATISTNAYKLRTGQARSSAVVPSGCIYTETTDIDAGTISWTDTPSEMCPVGLLIDDLTAGGGLLVNAGLGGGIA